MTLLKALKARTGFITPDGKLAILPELVRHFLTAAIEERAKMLAEPGKESLEQYRLIVSKDYSQRMEKTLNEEILLFKDSNRGLSFPSFVSGRLDQVYFRYPLTEAHFDSQERFEKMLKGVRSHFGFRGLFLAPPLPAREARAIASLLLRCVQKVVLQIISNDYPATAKKIAVPESTQKTIKDELARLDRIAATLMPFPALKGLPRAEAELNVAIARSELRVALPLRSIPTAPLTDKDLEKHYAGRPDEDARRLARQVRHADGTILVTGYRGVGKSSFVNRVIHHVVKYQGAIPADGWLIVPITINLAKVSGVQNILRLTLRSVRQALVEPDTAKPRPIPGFSGGPLLPLDKDKEIEPLQEAYSRATYKVSMTRANATERKWAVDGSLGLDVAKVVAPFAGFSLPSFGFKGSRSRTQTLNRSLSLLDYDENAAEDDIGQLIRRLAHPRPLYGKSGPMVRIKLVFIFDELDKMNLDDGLKPMIEGLKNLFLQQYAVFILVTSKSFYYYLLQERAIEDAMLNSYFSAIVPVPLLTFDQARKMVEAWIDWPDGVQGPVDIENKLLDQLTRWLLYRSYGNPRDIIRELRQMQEWADTTERPYLSDRLTKSQSLQIFAGIQECIEKAARADADAPPNTTSEGEGGGVTLVSERISGDESRLEQIRRGLYILTEALINRETLSLKPDDLKQVRENNFSLLLDSDVEQLARNLGFNLSLLHKSLPMEVFSSLALSEPPELFVYVDKDALRTTPEFYRLTGRQAKGGEVEVKGTSTEVKDVKELVSEAERRAQSGNLGDRRSVVGIIKQLGTSQVTQVLEEFLLNRSTNKNEPVDQRREAAKQLTQKMLFRDKSRDLAALVKQETDDEMLSLFLSLLGKATDEGSRKRATDAVISLFTSTTPVGGKSAETALTVLQAVADRGAVLDDVLEWLCGTAQIASVQESALVTLNLLTKKFKVDQADKILSSNKFLNYFVTASRPIKPINLGLTKNIYYDLLPMGSGLQNVQVASKFESHLRGLFAEKPLHYIEKLLQSNIEGDLKHLLTPLWQAAFDRTSRELDEFILGVMAKEDSTAAINRLLISLQQTPEFNVRMLPFLEKRYDELRNTYSEQIQERIKKYLKKLATPIEKPSPPAAPISGTSEALKALLEARDLNPRLRTPFPRGLEVEWTFALGATVVTMVTLFIEIFWFKWDLPQGASVIQALQSRALLLVADFSVVFLVVRQMALMRWNVNKSYSSPSFPPAKEPWWEGTVNALTPLGFTLFYVHSQYLGSLSVVNQLILFCINLPATVLISKFIAETMYSR